MSAEDESAIQDLCGRCADFWELIEGRPPEKDLGYDILNDLPPGKEMKDKYVFGAYDENDILIAVIEMIKDFVDVGEWIIALLMLDPGIRGKGLGKKLHNFVQDLVIKEQGNKLRIGVIEANINARKFWNTMGYHEIKRVEQRHGNKNQMVIVMNLLLT